ncbi:DUF350 domain-containing protein [Gordonia sp. HY002]|uniref:DUF350 domain-containing protein n=1 Tax=Gordonia zhenghanii TaxID=2911516 RepID=UPI001EEFB7D5|nr:DUF350 domain-containing protein [Gordonia zhenghanii]MCF8569084.1 DUF350 domain-containing protein [Gordonia zhenghanii]MCF8603403.1 DUF350 domain-containing protein [Gordonia zhenghanii]
MEPLEIFRSDIADVTSYGLLSVALLIVGFAALDLVTPGSLRTKVWVEQNRSAVVLSVAQSAGLAIALAAGIGASTEFELSKGVLFTLGYGIATIALMMFSFVLVDWLTPGKLGSVLLDEADGGYSRAAWLNAVVFVAIGLFVAAAL